MRADSDDQLRALLVGEQERDVLTDAECGNRVVRNAELLGALRSGRDVQDPYKD